jgi:predicted dithiol-disulfide oxidoreductase (DUF899 family)
LSNRQRSNRNTALSNRHARIQWFPTREDFNKNFGRTADEGEIFGLSVIFRDGKHIYRSYFTDCRGVEALGNVWSLLDVTPLRRQETGVPFVVSATVTNNWRSACCGSGGGRARRCNVDVSRSGQM